MKLIDDEILKIVPKSELNGLLKAFEGLKNRLVLDIKRNVDRGFSSSRLSGSYDELGTFCL